ncbi:hypothetical protein V1514DRAFT_350853 [Lipomyces japonicus]|uniref:uncharacterized protein n=1 Tax=Lipomyces japonicus TaxID=56871 RepID=UPI0034CFD796
MRTYTAVSILVIALIALLSYAYVAKPSGESVVVHTTTTAAAGPGSGSGSGRSETAGANSAWKSYIVTFTKGKDTPDSVVENAISKIKELGGQITHEYNTVLKGFSVSIPDGIASKGVIAAFKAETQNIAFPFTVEEDQEITIKDE